MQQQQVTNYYNSSMDKKSLNSTMHYDTHQQNDSQMQMEVAANSYYQAVH